MKKNVELISSHCQLVTCVKVANGSWSEFHLLIKHWCLLSVRHSQHPCPPPLYPPQDTALQKGPAHSTARGVALSKVVKTHIRAWAVPLQISNGSSDYNGPLSFPGLGQQEHGHLCCSSYTSHILAHACGLASLRFLSFLPEELKNPTAVFSLGIRARVIKS